MDIEVKEYLGKSKAERQFYLKHLEAAPLDAMLRKLGRSDDVPVSELMHLKEPVRSKVLQYAAQSDRIITVKPSNEPVRLLLPAEEEHEGKRKFRVIDKETTLPSRVAVNALYNFGLSAENEWNKGRLLEVSAGEVAAPVAPAPVAKPAVPTVSVEDVKALEGELESAQKSLKAQKGQVTRTKNELTAAQAENEELKKRIAELEAQAADTAPADTE